MKPKDPDTFIDIGVSITRLLLIASGQGMAASLIGEGAGLVKNLRSLLGSGGQRAVSAEKIAADVADQLFREHEGISEADWQVAATNVAPLIDRLSEKDRLAAGYDWKALRPVLRDLGSEERRCTLADEPARQAFDWVLEVACQHITDCFTKEEALASILRGINETKSGVRQLLDRPAGASKTQDVVNDHIKVLRDLAPDRLEDRESEMADLKAFVHSSDDVWYAMEADMVSGKTAVMVSFALNSPDDVRTVSFFIRRIGGDGNDRGSFAFVMSAQLAKILGHEYTEPVRDPAQHTEFRQLLRRAATACRSEATPRPLVLLIDGIDEDSYFENPDGADAKSILSLLPPHLPEGVKIITASRPNPRLPEDVLCDADRRIVSLKPSPIAEKSINRKDIAKFFKSDVAVDIGAFLAACGGVLTVEDLSRLLTTHRHQRTRTWDVREYVDRSPGRILTPVDIGFGGQEVLAYRLGHDVVTRAVIRELDPDSFGEGDEPEDERWWAQIREKTLAHYRAIIRDWVKKCASEGWGKSTPSYVLSGACFDLMLNDKKDDGSSIRVVLDQGRYNEMQRRSGRKYYALRMIDRECFKTLDANCGELSENAMTSLFEVAESKKLLVKASTYIAGLPKLYVSYFSITPDVALDMIMAIDEPKDRLDALRETMKAAIESGHGCALLTLLPTMFSSLVIYRDLRDEILHLLVDIIASIGDVANKSKVGSNESADPENQINEVIVLVEMIKTLLRSLSSFEKIDDLDNDARTIAPLLVVAEDIAERIEEPWERAKALAEVACTLARTGQTDIGLDIAGHTEDPGLRAKVLAEVACTLARAAQTDRARRVAENAVNVAERIEEPWERAKALAEVACTLARAAQTDIVLNVIEKIDNLRIGARLILDCECVEALLKVAGALANTAQTDMTIKISERIDNFEKYAEILVGVAGALVWEGQTDRAVDIAERIKHPRFRAEALAGVAGALAQTGQTDMARRVAENAVNVAGRIDESWMRAEVLAGVAGALGRAGRTDEALAVVGRIEDSWMRAGVFTIVADVLVRADQTDRAVDIAERIKHPRFRAEALAGVAGALAQTGQTDMARRVAENAVNVAGRIDEFWMRAEVLAGVAGALARAGQTDMALDVAGRIEDSWVRAGVFTIIVSVLVRAGQTDRAVDIAERIEDPEERVWALIEMKVADMLTGADRTDGVLDIARQIKDPEEHASALVKIADALIWAGFIDKAFKIVETMDDIYFRNRAQSAIIKALVRKGSSNEAVNMLHTALAEVEGFVRRQDAADCCATLAAACVDAADFLADSADAEPAERDWWFGLARSALARSWLYGAPVWNCFDVLLRVAPDLATRLVKERLLADPDPTPGAEPRPGSDPEGPGGGAPSSR
ncbi:hypothetical protein [uncultured Actinomyces sp.]|uniref:hypothetical protein n=1 Tax=uncultured Actinomyces sp. TaxID=249061 RepID=UPI0028894BC4|nr:hypothetical protein [uncultured Actinomyces sp.]